MGEKLFDWAWSIIGGAPPMQNIGALIVILFLAAPLLFDGIKKFRELTRSRATTSPQIDLILETPLLVQTISRIESKVEELGRDVGRLIYSVDQLARRNARNDATRDDFVGPSDHSDPSPKL